MSFDLRLGDCLDPVTGLASLADASIDCVITDPPYSEHVHSKSKRGADGWKGDVSLDRDLGFSHLTAEVMTACADHFARLARRWVLVFCDVESSHLWAGELRASGLDYVRTCAWIKVGCTPQFTGDRPAVGFEAIVVAHQPGRKRWNGGGKRGVYECPIVLERGAGERRLHTTQKPIKLIRELVEDFTDAGETVLDPFAGSGTTLAACVGSGRNAIGWERDPQFYERAIARLNGDDAKPAPGQLAMFGGAK